MYIANLQQLLPPKIDSIYLVIMVYNRESEPFRWWRSHLAAKRLCFVETTV